MSKSRNAKCSTPQGRAKHIILEKRRKSAEKEARSAQARSELPDTPADVGAFQKKVRAIYDKWMETGPGAPLRTSIAERVPCERLAQLKKL